MTPMSEIREAVIVDTARTAFGKRNGALAPWHPTDLLGFTLRTVLERNQIDPEIIDDVVGGCVNQAGEQATNVTRNAWVAAGLPWRGAGPPGRPPGGAGPQAPPLPPAPAGGRACPPPPPGGGPRESHTPPR